MIPHLQSIWHLPNDQRHLCDVALITTELERGTHADLAELDALRHRVLPVDRVLFHSSLSDHLKHATSSIAAWISLHAHTITHSSQKAAAQNLPYTRPISTYFIPSS